MLIGGLYCVNGFEVMLGFLLIVVGVVGVIGVVLWFCCDWCYELLESVVFVYDVWMEDCLLEQFWGEYVYFGYYGILLGFCDFCEVKEVFVYELV